MANALQCPQKLTRSVENYRKVLFYNLFLICYILIHRRILRHAFTKTAETKMSAAHIGAEIAEDIEREKKTYVY